MSKNIFYIIPWNSEKNIGVSYNKSFSMVGPEDWICFIDGDAVNTSSFFGKRIEEVIEKNPEYSLFTCYTNRIGTRYQIPEGVDWNNNDMRFHRQLSDILWNKYNSEVLDITNESPLSGVMILSNKKTWEDVGGFLEQKMLGVDNDYHFKVKNSGKKIGLMRGIYLQHWYRGGNIRDKSHLL